jgi:hypothetical protein
MDILVVFVQLIVIFPYIPQLNLPTHSPSPLLKTISTGFVVLFL